MIEVEWIFSYLLLGSFVGIMAGLLGIGGGGIMVPILTVFFLKQGISPENVVHLALGTSMASIVVTSFSSLRAHNSRHGVVWDIAKKMSPGIIIGTFLATFLATYLSSYNLAWFFTIFMAYMSIQMLINKRPRFNGRLVGSKGYFIAGTGIGAISALVSIGGGSLTVPFLMWKNLEIKKAIGTSAAIGLPISLAGTFGYLISGWSSSTHENYTFGFVYFPAVLLISIASFTTAPYGVKLAHKLPTTTLKKIFAILLIILSLKMLQSIY